MSDDQIDVKITASVDGLKEGMKQASDHVSEFAKTAKHAGEESASGFEVLGEKASGLRHIIEGLSDPVHGLYNDVKELAEAFLVAFAVEKVKEFAEEMAEVGAAALHASMELGMSVEQITAFNYAAGAMGIGAESADMGLMRLERTIGMASSGSKQAEGAFKALGVSIRDSSGHMKDADTILREVADSFKEHADGAEKTTLAMELMGRAGAKMIPVLNEGAEGLDKLRQEGERTGTVLSTEMAEGMEQTALKFHEMGAATEGVGITLFEVLKPAVDSSVEGFTHFVESLNDSMKEGGSLREVVETLAMVVEDCAVAIEELSSTIGDVAGIFIDAAKDINNSLGLTFEEKLPEGVSKTQYYVNVFKDDLIVVKDIIVATVELIVECIEYLIAEAERLGNVLNDVFTLQWGSIADDWDAGTAKLEEIVRKRAGNIRALMADMYSANNDAKTGFDHRGVDHQDKDWDKWVHPGGEGHKPSYTLPKTGGHEKKPKKDTTAQKLADEELQNIEKMALEEVKIEEEKNATLLQLGQRTLEDYVTMQKALEDRKYQIQQEYYTKKAAADAKDKVAHQKDLDQLKLIEVQHREALQKIDDQYRIKKRQEAQAELTDQNQRDSQALQDEIQDIEEKYKRHQITSKQRASLELELTAVTRREAVKRLDAELSTLVPGTELYRKVYKQREDIVRQWAQDVKKINNDLYTEEHKKWADLGNSIKSSFNSSLNGMLLGTMSFQQGLAGIINGIAGAFLNMAEQILENWIATMIAKKVATKAASATDAVSQITAAAGVAAANTFASIAAIPIVGPAMAPGAAAASMAAVLSFNSLAFAEQGMLLDRDRLVYAHKDEQILPAHLSKGIQNIINNGGDVGGKGDTHLNYSPQINAPAHKSLEDLLYEEGHTMRAWLAKQRRNGAI